MYFTHALETTSIKVETMPIAKDRAIVILAMFHADN